MTYTWTAVAPYFTTTAPSSFTITSGNKSTLTLPEINWNPASDSASGELTFSTEPSSALENYFSYAAATRVLSFEDNGAAAAYIGQADLRITLKVKNKVTNKTTLYTIALTMTQYIAPTVPTIANFPTLMTILTDTNSTLVSPAVTEGTLAPAVATWIMSTDLVPFITITSYTSNAKTYMNFTYTVNATADTLVGKSDLQVQITLSDAAGQS